MRRLYRSILVLGLMAIPFQGHCVLPGLTDVAVWAGKKLGGKALEKWGGSALKKLGIGGDSLQLAHIDSTLVSSLRQLRTLCRDFEKTVEEIHRDAAQVAAFRRALKNSRGTLALAALERRWGVPLSLASYVPSSLGWNAHLGKWDSELARARSDFGSSAILSGSWDWALSRANSGGVSKSDAAVVDRVGMELYRANEKSKLARLAAQKELLKELLREEEALRGRLKEKLTFEKELAVKQALRDISWRKIQLQKEITEGELKAYEPSEDQLAKEVNRQKRRADREVQKWLRAELDR